VINNLENHSKLETKKNIVQEKLLKYSKKKPQKTSIVAGNPQLIK
jgi:hypothetical protein